MLLHRLLLISTTRNVPKFRFLRIESSQGGEMDEFKSSLMTFDFQNKTDVSRNWKLRSIITMIFCVTLSFTKKKVENNALVLYVNKFKTGCRSPTVSNINNNYYYCSWQVIKGKTNIKCFSKWSLPHWHSHMWWFKDCWMDMHRYCRFFVHKIFHPLMFKCVHTPLYLTESP